MSETIRDIFEVLKYFKKQNIFFLVLLMILVSILELIGLSLVIPFVTVMIEPNLPNNFFFSYFSTILKNFDSKSYSTVMIILILFFFLVKNLFIIFVVMKQTRYSMSLITLIRNNFFERYLNEDYVEFVKKEQSELISNIMNVSANFGLTFVNNLLIFLSEFLIIIGIILLLLFFNFKLTLGLLLIFLLTIFFYLRYISPKLKRAGGQRLESDQNVINYSKLSFQNFKELKIFDKEKYFLKIFSDNAKISEDSNYFYNVSAQYPRLGMEIFAVLAITILTITMNYFGFLNNEIITTLAFFGAAIFRILPSANKLMFSFQGVRFSKNTLDTIRSEINKKNNTKKKDDEFLSKINFDEHIQVDNISFGYDSKNPIIKNLSFEIQKGEFIGIKGESGSGKSTLIDILIGLIKPTNGKILVDGTDILKNLKSWQSKCSYVSQNIFLINDTIASNVAFGEDKKDIDIEKVLDSLKKAELLKFVSQLTDKENTVIGENGLAISGGQRQRLAIARALYRNPEIIFFDEATSALDDKTEKNLINSVINLKGKLTIIFVSHDLNIFKNCDKIIEI